jgi:hypothetical protein
MNAAKMTPDLKAQLTEAEAAKVLDVVLEVHSQSQETAAPRSRREAIALRKEAFSHDVVPVEEAVNEVGGEVVGRAWINQTVRARVPAHGLEQLSELDEVAVLDVPHALQAEVG